MKNNLYLDLHVLQTVPPSLVNRDDTGSPKTAVYGGTVRARVSSQAWKHAMRGYMKDMRAEGDIGLRTKKIVDLVVEEMTKLKPTLDPEKYVKEAQKALGDAGIKIDEKKGDASALFFISPAQAKAIAELVVAGNKDKKALQKAVKENPAVDMILFGRMVASDPSLNYDAAAQVAHSISTHRVHTEYDYFTAVDDCAPEDNAGAGHLGTVEFNSSTLYRYATLNILEVKKWLGADTAAAAADFAEAFICSMPTGKQNTFANRTLPDAVYITLRRDQPVNLCGAFETPVRSDNGYVDASVKMLSTYAAKVYANFAAEPAHQLTVGAELEGLAVEKLSLKDALTRVATWIDSEAE